MVYSYLPFFLSKDKDMACTSCKKKKEVIVETIIENRKSKFRMRENTGLHQISFGSGLFISNSNITDELAIEFLKENPNRISLFEIYPEDWKELLTSKNNVREKSKSK